MDLYTYYRLTKWFGIFLALIMFPALAIIVLLALFMFMVSGK
jgi:hypothetical protein